MSNIKGGSFAALPAGTVLSMAVSTLANIEAARVEKLEKVYAKYVGRY